MCEVKRYFCKRLEALYFDRWNRDKDLEPDAWLVNRRAWLDIIKNTPRQLDASISLNKPVDTLKSLQQPETLVALSFG